MDVSLDTSEADDFARDLLRESTLIRRRTNAAVDAGIDLVYASAVADAGRMRDTGAMVAATFKSKRSGGYTRIVRCTDPAGMMNEFGNHGRPPRPWLLVHADAGADRVVMELQRGLDEFAR